MEQTRYIKSRTTKNYYNIGNNMYWKYETNDERSHLPDCDLGDTVTDGINEGNIAY